jgi:nucleoside-diphosphate-sugar epimerase
MNPAALITGGAGFIGSHLAAALIGEGTRVRVLDDLSTGRRENLAGLAGDHELVEEDVRDRGAVRRAVRGVQAVFHLAAEVSVPRSVEDPGRCYGINTLGTVNLLEACREEGVERIVFSSSCAVYGDEPTLPKVEDMLPEPLSPYASSKVTGEHLMRIFSRLHGLHAVSLRYFNVYGPRQDPSSEYAAVIPKFVERMTRGAPPVVFGDGRQTRDFVFVEDVVRANLAAARTPEASGGVFNVGSGRSVDLLALIGELLAVLGRRAEPVFEAPRAGDVPRSSADVSRAARVLGWRAETNLREGLARTVAGLGGEAR